MCLCSMLMETLDDKKKEIYAGKGDEFVRNWLEKKEFYMLLMLLMIG